MATSVFRRNYYGKTNKNGHNVATFWVSRERECNETVYKCGVSFGTTAVSAGCNFITTECFDGVSFATCIDYAPRASKKRDSDACYKLYALALTQNNVVNALEGMGVYCDVYDDSAREVWAR